MANYIILNGKNSNTITGLLIQNLPPISKPLQRTLIEEIDGRDGDIVTKLGYGAYDKEITIGLYGSYNVDDVISYFDSEGVVTFSNEPDKYYNYQIIDQIDFERLIRFKTATVRMHVQPFKYLLNEPEIEVDARSVTGEGQNIELKYTIENGSLSITPKGNTEQTTYTGKNLFDINSITEGKFYYIDQNKIVGNANWNMSDYIKVNGNTNYIASYIKSTNYSQLNYSYYGENKNLLGGVGASSNTDNYSILTPANAYYIRLGYRNNGDYILSNIQLEQGSTATEYEPFVGGSPSPSPDYPQPIEVVTGDNTINIHGKNLFNKDSVVGGFVNADGTVGGDTNAYKTSDFISIQPNTAYYKTNTASPRTKYFDSNKQPLNTTTYQDISIGGSAGTFTTPNNAYYLRFSYPIASVDADSIQIEKGTSFTEYEPYQSQTYPINLGVENLSQLENISTTAEGYITKSNSAIGTLKANTTYTLSMNCSTEYTSTTKNLSIRNYYMPGQTTNEVLFDLTYKSGQRISCTFTPNYDGELSINAYLGASYTNVFTNIELVKGSTAQYVSDTPIELCKIGTYQDYIYKENNKWYKHSEIGKVVLDGSENWVHEAGSQTPTPRTVVTINSINFLNNNYYSNYFILNSTTSNRIVLHTVTSQLYLSLENELAGIINSDTNQQKVDKIKSWLSTHNTIVYYILATPTNTEITDTDLISQLDSINSASAYKEVTNISSTCASGNSLMYMSAVSVGMPNTTIKNNGNIFAKPILTIYGSGEISVYLDTIQVLQIDLGDYGSITIDVSQLEAYNESTGDLMNRNVIGDYSNLKIKCGDNDLTFSGNVMGFTMTKYNRWL